MAYNLKPSFAEEELLVAQGYQLIAGVDEVGRGALAGPVMAAAVILPGRLNVSWLGEVRESKQLTPTRRGLLSQQIQKVAISIGIGTASHEMVDTQGIIRATRFAMKSAIDQLSPPPQCLLIDYMRLPEALLPQKGIVNGDGLCFSIACASILAKVARDALMVELDRFHPGYGLAEHKGYGTRKHLICLQRMGPSPVHRRSFKPVRNLI